MHPIWGQPNKLWSADPVYRSGAPHLVTQRHPDLAILLVLHRAKVLAIGAVALVRPPALDFEELHAAFKMLTRARAAAA